MQKKNSVVRYRQDDIDREVEARYVVLATPALISHQLGVDLDDDVREALARIEYGPFVSAAFLTNETEPWSWDNAYAIAARSARSMLRSTCRISCTATPPSGNRAAAS